MLELFATTFKPEWPILGKFTLDVEFWRWKKAPCPKEMGEPRLFLGLTFFAEYADRAIDADVRPDVPDMMDEPSVSTFIRLDCPSGTSVQVDAGPSGPITEFRPVAFCNFVSVVNSKPLNASIMLFASASIVKIACLIS